MARTSILFKLASYCMVYFCLPLVFLLVKIQWFIFETHHSELVYALSEKEKVRALFKFKNVFKKFCAANISSTAIQKTFSESQSNLKISEMLIFMTAFKM